MSRNVGVIGLGAMGMGVARSLLRGGFNVHACDVRREVLDQFVADGGKACASPAELGARCDVVVTLVVNAAQTETVLFGEQGAVRAMKPGGVVIACATVAPDFAIDLGRRVEAAGLHLLDAPVSGGAALLVSLAPGKTPAPGKPHGRRSGTAGPDSRARSADRAVRIARKRAARETCATGIRAEKTVDRGRQ